MTDPTPAQGYTAFSHDGGDVGVLLIHGFPGAPGSLQAWADHLDALRRGVKVVPLKAA